MLAGRIRLFVVAAVVGMVGVGWAIFARGRAESWIAVVSDSACGAEHSEAGHADCVRKCARGGAAIGHPEWKPQALVLVRESDHSVWRVDNVASLQGFEGQKVTAEVEAYAEKKSVHVKEVTAGSERRK